MCTKGDVITPDSQGNESNATNLQTPSGYLILSQLGPQSELKYLAGGKTCCTHKLGILLLKELLTP